MGAAELSESRAVAGAASPTAVVQETRPAGGLGLSEQEVSARRARGQGNRTKTATSRSYWQIVQDNLLTFLNLTLIAIGLILVVMGETKDAILASGLAVINGLVGIVLETRAKRRLDQIALLGRTTATVIRDGQERAVDPDEVVVGDVLVARPGDQIIVDGRVVGDEVAEVDESLLTGEADPIRKQQGDTLSSGSFCTSGMARYEAEKVGAESLAATMAAGARAFRVSLTPLQQNTNLIIRLLLVIAGFLLLLLLLGATIWEYPFRDTVLAAAVILGIVPSGLFLMITVAYATGAIRLASQDALIQQTNAVESLSNVDVFCMDKTGTLTANKLVLVEVRPIGGDDDAEVRRMLGTFARSASGGTKTSEAIVAAADGQSVPLAGEITFSSARKWSAVAIAGGEVAGVFALGAPEMLAPLLQGGPELRSPEGWTEQGYRVLLFAHAPEVVPLRDAAGEARLPADLAPVAWLGFTDELRPNSRETLEAFRRGGITLKVISGDNPETVAALARQAGFPPDAKLISGLELAEMGDAEFAQAAHEATIFGRITPEQKRRLVQALRDGGHYVAMTGDGVNDVLSLKHANLGIAMQSGSQATRAAADIVLLHDSFGALPAAFREGQRIRRGLQETFYLFLTRVFTVALIILAVAVIDAAFPFSPGHMSLLTLLTVGVPTFALTMFAQSQTVPQRPIRSLLRFVLPATLLLSVAAFAAYVVFYFMHDIDLQAQRAGGAAAATSLPAADQLARDALTYVLILGGLWLVVFAAPPTAYWAVVEPTIGDWRPTIVAVAMLGVYAVVLAVPPLRAFFGVHLLSVTDYLTIAAIVLYWALLLRLVWRKRVFDRFFGYLESA